MSSYLQYLPAVLQQGDFLGRFLLAFEAILSRKVDLSQASEQALSAQEQEFLKAEKDLPGLGQILDEIHRFFDPSQTPEDFLPWLAQWVAASLRDDWAEATRRNFIGKIVPLYRKRGTREGIEAVLQLSGEDAKVVDFSDGLDEELETREFRSGPRPPHFFGVILTVNQRDPVELARRVRRVRAIVEREKPSHTVYALLVKYPAMRINNDPQTNPALGEGILVGKNTVLGTKKD